VSDADFASARLSGNHDRSAFACGPEPLDRYFRQQASQDIRCRIANCFVVREIATGGVAGYYTLAAINVRLAELPPSLTARLPHYPTVPAASLGRLAIATTFQGRKLESVLLSDAITRTALADLGAFAMVVDPQDDTARRFYEQHGFLVRPLPEHRMFIPIETAFRQVRNFNEGTSR
jgi:ribosomal protein S18 acetylase RimI-like enzyme